MDPDQFAQQMTWEESQGGHQTDLRIVYKSTTEITLRDLKSGKDFEFTGDDAPEQVAQALQALAQRGQQIVS